MERQWRIELLGGLRASRGEQIVSHFRTRKMADLLAYLAYFRQRSHPREVLVDLLWPEADLDAGRHNLSMALTFLRHLLEPPGVPDGSVVVANRHAAGLDAAAITTDVAEFETALKAAAGATAAERGTFLTAAVESYGGELLPGHYDDWIIPEQQRLDELYFQALRQLILHLEGEKDLARAVQFALRAVAVNRLREEAHREVIRLYAAAGRTDAALRQYRELERVLRDELGTAPAAETRALVSALRGGDAGPGGSASAPPPAPPSGTAEVSLRASEAPPETLPAPRSDQLEPVGGAVLLGSKFYVARPADREFHEAIARRDSIVLVKGPRQVGKTSLLARGLQQAREAGAKVVLTHFQTLSAADFESSEALLLALAENLAEQLDLDAPPVDTWDARRSPNLNFRRYLRRQVLGTAAERGPAPLVWGLDEVDRLFSCSFGSEIFGLFRSWHDERALEPDGPWGNLTLAIAYSTEAHLFITDVNQSPFNVGTRLELEDFTLEQVADLNRRYGAPLRQRAELARYNGLVGGHPYLVRRGLHQMVAHGTQLAVLESRASSNDWIFGEHLRRIVLLLTRDPELCEAARAVLQGRPCPTDQAFYRMRSAGVLTGETAQEARLRCHLYASYLKRHLL
jgi:DNA-binding SARP family transcriptional activator